MATNQSQVIAALAELKNAKRNKSGSINGNAAWAVATRYKAFHGHISYEDTEFSRQIHAAVLVALNVK